MLDGAQVAVPNPCLEGIVVVQLGFSTLGKAFLADLDRGVDEYQVLGERETGVQRVHEIESALDGLIGEAGKKIAVADDDLALANPRLDADLGSMDMLAAVRRIEKRDGAGVGAEVLGEDGRGAWSDGPSVGSHVAQWARASRVSRSSSNATGWSCPRRRALPAR